MEQIAPHCDKSSFTASGGKEMKEIHVIKVLLILAPHGETCKQQFTRNFLEIKSEGEGERRGRQIQFSTDTWCALIQINGI